MHPVTILRIIESYIDYFTPREILGPAMLVFAAENVVDRLFQIYLPIESEIMGWVGILILVTILIGVWGELDEDKEKLEEEVEDIIEEEEENR